MPARRRYFQFLLAILAVIALALAGWLVRGRIALSGASERHIAVLPISSLGGEPANAALAEGIQESLTSRLSNLEVGNQSLWVVPASEVQRRKVSDAAAAQKEFGVNLVITGSVQRDGSLLRLTVNLIDARNLRQVGSGQFEDRTGDFSTLQDSAVAKLANLMKIAVTPEMLHATGGAVQPAAYETYLKARGYLQRPFTAAAFDEAIKLLGSAVQQDPKFSLAFASLGQAYLVKYQNDQDPRWLDQASANCKQALALNDQLAPVYITLGGILKATGQNDLALEQIQRALRLEPRNADALVAEAQVFEAQGRLKESEETLRRAAALRPDYWIGYDRLALFYVHQRRFADAVKPYERVLEIMPNNAEAYNNLGTIYRNLGDRAKAAVLFEKAISLAPGTYRFYSNLGLVRQEQGNYGAAVQALEKAAALNEKDYRVWMNLAQTDRRLGDTQKAAAAYAHALPLVEDMATRQPQDAIIQAVLGRLYAALQPGGKALPHLESALALAPKDAFVLEIAAVGYEALGNRHMAIDCAVRAVHAGKTVQQLGTDPWLRDVLADPGFKPSATSSKSK